ncbi:MAG: ParB/RepB/Spo0J family partition protein [Clostridia bacterium]|nr:ParB/RepB/Spo0J family partition protein [Clostridia bacterium]
MPQKKIGGLGKNYFDIVFDNSTPEPTASNTVNIRLSEIEPRSDQPRKQFDREALESLADSIASLGVLQPIIVRENPVAKGFYEIIAGERRWRAAKIAGLNEIPAIVLDSDEYKTAQISLIENIQRENLNPVEEAQAYKTLLERFGITQEELSKQVNRSRSAIANMIRLLDLPEPVLEHLSKGELTTGHARAILPIEDEQICIEVAERIINSDLSVRSVEKWVRDYLDKKDRVPEVIPIGQSTARQRKVYMRELESKAESVLGRKLRIHETPKKKVIEIAFSDDEDLEYALKTICGEGVFDDLSK